MILYNNILFVQTRDKSNYYSRLFPGFFYVVRNYARKHKIMIDTGDTWNWENDEFLGSTLEEVKDTIDSYFAEKEAGKYNL